MSRIEFKARMLINHCAMRPSLRCLRRRSEQEYVTTQANLGSQWSTYPCPRHHLKTKKEETLAGDIFLFLRDEE